MKTMRVNFENMKSEAFWYYNQTVYSKEYFGYMFEVEEQKYYYDNGKIMGYYAIFLLKHNDRGTLEEVYTLNTVALDAKKLWEYIATLELEVASSDFQHLESLELFQKLARACKLPNTDNLLGIDSNNDLWYFVPVKNHHVEVFQKAYLGNAEYEDKFHYIETIPWHKMTPLERKKVLGWCY